MFDGGRSRRERGGDRDRERERDRDFDRERKDHKRTASPPPRKRESTPDLTDVPSVLDRKRRLTQWDIKPVGYENVTAEQAKLSGRVPFFFFTPIASSSRAFLSNLLGIV